MKFLQLKTVLVFIILTLLIFDASGWLFNQKKGHQKNKSKQRQNKSRTKTNQTETTRFRTTTFASLVISSKNLSAFNQPKIESTQTCDVIAIKLKILSFIASKKLLAKEVSTIWMENENPAERISLINKTLEKHNLQPFSPCRFSSTTSIPEKSGLEKITTDKNFVATSCESRKKFLSKIQKMFLSNNLSFEKILKIYEENKTVKDKIKKLNKIIAEENLRIPPVPLNICEFNAAPTPRTMTTATKPIDCVYLKDTSNRARIALVNELEAEGWLPSNSVSKVVFGWISRAEMKKMVIIALVKSGRIPSVCLNRTTTTPNPIRPPTSTTTKSQVIIAESAAPIAAVSSSTTAAPKAEGETETSKLVKISLSTVIPSNPINDVRHKSTIKNKSTIKKPGHMLPSRITPAVMQHRVEAIPFYSSTLTNGKKAKQGAEKALDVDDTWYRNFVMSHLPDSLRKLIESGKMPDYIEEAIFSGTHERDEIAQMIVDNEEVMRALLPQRILNMLQDRPIPEGLKRLFLSGKNESEIRKEIEGNSTLLQELMTPSTYFFYTLFSIPRNRNISSAISVIMIITLAVVMTSLGCTMTISEIKKHARKPKGVVIALIAQFLVMPAASFGLTQLFGLKEFAAIAVLICGCCPGGNLSNILAYALKGDMNLSILMTSCSSVLGLGLMPLNIFLYSKLIIPLDSGQVVPFDKIITNIALTIFPVGFGIAVRHFKPHWVKKVMRVGALILLINSITVGVLSGVMFGTAFFAHFPLPVVACCAILPLVGFVFGYLLGWIGKEPPKCVRTISVETGCQNVQLCSTVLKLAFDPVLVGVLFLLPLIYMCFQVLEALLMIFSFRLYHYLRYGKDKNVEESSDEKKKPSLSSRDDNNDIEKISEKASKNEMAPLENVYSTSTKPEAQPFIVNGKVSRLSSVRSIDSETFV